MPSVKSKSDSVASFSLRGQEKHGGMKKNSCASGMFGTGVLCAILALFFYGGMTFEYDAFTRLESTGLVANWAGNESGELLNSFIFQVVGAFCLLVGFLIISVLYHYVMKRDDDGKKSASGTCCSISGTLGVFFLLMSLALTLSATIFFGLNWDDSTLSTLNHQYTVPQFALSLTAVLLVAVVTFVFTTLTCCCMRWELDVSERPTFCGLLPVKITINKKTHTVGNKKENRGYGDPFAELK